MKISGCEVLCGWALAPAAALYFFGNVLLKQYFSEPKNYLVLEI